jgi:hypothetical protein
MSPATTPGALGPYRLLRTVSDGVRGTVHEGVHAKHPEQRVAIRTLSAASIGGATALKRMRRGALAATGLQHPNIVGLHECGEHEGVAFVATEFVEGDTLAQHLARVGRLPALQGLALVAQLLCALAFTHRRRLVHGAIHPGNLLISRTGQLKIAGFGWAAVAAADARHPGPFHDPQYLAPEQRAGAPADHRSDLYGAARVAHEVLSGRAPASPDADSLGLPDPLSLVFARALAHDPRERHASATDLLSALQAAVGAPMWERPPVGATRAHAQPPSSTTPPPATVGAHVLVPGPAPSGATAKPAGPPGPPADVPAVRAPQAVAHRASRPLSVRTRRTLGAAAAAVILVAAVFMVREPAAPPQDGVQQPKPTAGTEAVERLQVAVTAPSMVGTPASVAGVSSAQATARVERLVEQRSPEPLSIHAPAWAPPVALPIEAPRLDTATTQPLQTRASPQPAAAPPREVLAQREPVARSAAATPRVAARADGEGTAQSTLRARRTAAAASAAQRSPMSLACDQATAIGREVCRAVRCVSPEWRRHPVCVRLASDRRARDAEREWRGSN